MLCSIWSLLEDHSPPECSMDRDPGLFDCPNPIILCQGQFLSRNQERSFLFDPLTTNHHEPGHLR
jgi:hypothetical protein